MKECVLEKGKICNDCGRCDDRCELDPNKICDNCFQCLDRMAENRAYADIPIDKVYTENDFLVPDPPTLPVKSRYVDVATLYGLRGKRRGRRA